jgi:hypothetical protein
MGLITTTSIDLQQLVSATGAGGDVDIKDYKGQVDFYLNAKSSSGTNPTLTAKLQHSNQTIGASYVEVGDVDVELREGATTNVKLAAKFTQSGARSVKKILLPLRKNGAVASGNLTCTLQANSGSDPSGTPLGTATFSTDSLATSYEYVTFEFTTPVELSDATVYWIVLEGAYTASGTVNVTWRTDTVGSGGNISKFDNTNWAATTTQSAEFIVYQYNFADVTGGGFTQVTSTGGHEGISLNIDTLNRYVRVYRTIGGTSSPAFYESVFVRGYKDN